MKFLNPKRLFAVVLWVLAWWVACTSAYANPPVEAVPKKAEASTPVVYEAITKFPLCWLVGGSDGCDGVTEPENLRRVLPSGVDETDVKACEVIAQNVNDMEMFEVDWSCGFSISPNAFLLSKPQWKEITGKENCDANRRIQKNGYNETDEQFCKRVGSRPLYGFSYDLDGAEGDEKIYAYFEPNFSCDVANGYTRTNVWTAENDGSSLDIRRKQFSSFSRGDEDLVIFDKRPYFIAYSDRQQGSLSPNHFVVSRFFEPMSRIGNEVKHRDMVCVISPVGLKN